MNLIKKQIAKQLERYSKSATYPRKKTPLVSLEISTKSAALLEIEKEFKILEKRMCGCGKHLSKTQKLCGNCTNRIKDESGIKFIAPKYDIHFKKTGIKCSFKDCETLTERLDRVCFYHSSAISKSKKYKTNVPKKDLKPGIDY